MQEEGRDRQAIDAFASACADVPDRDRLLSTVVQVCDESVDALSSMLELAEEGCHGRNCAEMAQEAVVAVDELIATARRGDAEIAESVEDGDCREALATPPEFYEAFVLLSEAFDDLDDALRTDDPAAFDMAAAKMEKGEALFEDVPSARELLTVFRKVCSARGEPR
ncbi:MAG: hypothetical protein WD399_01620 [Thermoleophilaceae bacterium]